jgi:hypothetical protein
MALWPTKTLYDRIIDRHKEKDDDYSKVNRNREVISTYFRSDEIIKTDDAGNLVGEAIYNGAGSWYSRMMATGFQGQLVSKNIPWVRYQMREQELKGLDELDIWLQEIKEYMADAYQRSNFYDVQPQFTHDGLTTGSPVIFGEEDVLGARTMWLPQHYTTVRLYYDRYNHPEGVIVEDKQWTAKKIMDTFVKGDDEQGTKRKELLPVSVNVAIDGGRYNEVFTVYRATFKVSDPIWDGTGENAFKKPSGGWQWLTAYFAAITEADNVKKNRPLNSNMGDFTRPFATWNFDKKPWEPSSRTPAFYALWDNLSLQQIDKNYMEDIQASNRPPIIALDSMGGRLQLGPEGEMLVTEAQYDRPPKAIDRLGNIQFSKDLLDMKDESLRRWFYIDMLQMFSDLAMKKNQPPTATQIWQMAGEKATLLSPAIETHSRYLEITDARMIDIEVRAGRGPFAPDRMSEITDIILSNISRPISKVGVQPVFIGRLAQAQKASQSLEPIQSTMQAVAPLMELFPEIRHMYRPYDLADDINEALDFPQKNVRPRDEYEQMVQAEREAIAQQQQAQMAIEAAKAAKGVSGPVDETSVLAGATG